VPAGALPAYRVLRITSTPGEENEERTHRLLPRERSECWGRWIRPALGPETEGAGPSNQTPLPGFAGTPPNGRCAPGGRNEEPPSIPIR
jgi:hypothetical protein